MDWTKVHQGIHRQGRMSDEEVKAQQEAGLVPGVNPDLRAPEIANPADAPELNLHGDVDGSPYSANPGEISLAEAGEKAKADTDAPAEDMADTRAREVKSRRTGVPTETLAAEDEGDTPAPKRSSKK